MLKKVKKICESLSQKKHVKKALEIRLSEHYKSFQIILGYITGILIRKEVLK